MHKAVHTCRAMGRKTNTAVGVRIPNDLLEAIEAEAEANDMSRNQLIVTRLRTSLFGARRLRKTITNQPEYANGESLRNDDDDDDE